MFAESVMFILSQDFHFVIPGSKQYTPKSPAKRHPRTMWSLSVANCYSAHDSLGFPVLLPFCDAQSDRSFHPLHRYPSPLARTGRGPFRSCRVASPQAPTPDRESLPATSAQSTPVGPHPRRLDGALGASNPSAPFRNCTEALDT